MSQCHQGLERKKLVPKQDLQLRQCPWSADKALKSRAKVSTFGSLLQFPLVEHEKFESELDLWSLFVLSPSSQGMESNGRIV